MISIRELTSEDAPAYHALRLRMLREHAEAFTSAYEEDCIKPLSWVEARLTASDTSPHKFVLGAFSPGGEIAGSIGLAVEERIKQRHKALLFGMFVAPEAARRGRVLPQGAHGAGPACAAPRAAGRSLPRTLRWR